jgi:hypothetical protein
MPIGESIEIAQANQTPDSFINRHLHYLPIPRFQGEPTRPTIEGLYSCTLKLQTLCGVDVTESFIADFDDDHSVTDLYSIFQDLMPNLDTLRDMHLPETNLKCALALLALDPNEFRKINSTMIHYHDFPNLAIRAIQQEIKDSTVSTVLDDVDAYLCKRYVDIAMSLLPEAGQHWIPYAIAKDQMMLELPSLEKYAMISGLSLEALYAKAYVKNLVDEDPEIGFRVIEG